MSEDGRHLDKLKVHVFFGMDCGPQKNLAQEKARLDSRFNDPNVEVEVHCHSTFVAARNVYRSYKQKSILDEDEKTNELFKNLKLESQVYGNVLVYGFSFGGAVINRISEMFDEEMFDEKSTKYPNVRMATFGSAYLAKTRDGKRELAVNKPGNYVLINYIAKHDIAHRVNQFKSTEYGAERVIERGYKYTQKATETEESTTPEAVTAGEQASLALHVPVRNQAICLNHCDQESASIFQEKDIHFGYDSLFLSLCTNREVDISKLQKGDKLERVRRPGMFSSVFGRSTAPRPPQTAGHRRSWRGRPGSGTKRRRAARSRRGRSSASSKRRRRR